MKNPLLTPAPEVPDALLTRDQVAGWLAVGSRTIDRMVAAGRIPYVKLGSGRNSPLRFRRSAVESALQRMEAVG